MRDTCPSKPTEVVQQVDRAMKGPVWARDRHFWPLKHGKGQLSVARGGNLWLPTQIRRILAGKETNIHALAGCTT